MFGIVLAPDAPSCLPLLSNVPFSFFYLITVSYPTSNPAEFSLKLIRWESWDSPTSAVYTESLTLTWKDSDVLCSPKGELIDRRLSKCHSRTKATNSFLGSFLFHQCCILGVARSGLLAERLIRLHLFN